jgi:hypothetical protein
MDAVADTCPVGGAIDASEATDIDAERSLPAAEEQAYTKLQRAVLVIVERNGLHQWLVSFNP